MEASASDTAATLATAVLLLLLSLGFMTRTFILGYGYTRYTVVLGEAMFVGALVVGLIAGARILALMHRSGQGHLDSRDERDVTV